MLKGYFIERDQVGGGQMSEGAPFVQPQSCIINLFTQLYTNSTQFSGAGLQLKGDVGKNLVSLKKNHTPEFHIKFILVHLNYSSA